jgi:hypothetical protein
VKTYVAATGVIFGLVTLAHLWRMAVERQLGTQPWYILITIVTGALSFWAWHLLRKTGRP